MALIEFTSLKSMEVISQDALLVGKVTDVRCENATWKVKGIKLKTERSISDRLNAGSGKSIVLFRPDDYKIRDVLLFPDGLDIAKNRVVPDSSEYISLLSVIGMKVLSEEDVTVGAVDEILIDTENWTAVSIKVKLVKEAHEPLGVKKGIFGNKVVSGLLTSDIDIIDASQIKLCLSIKEIRSQIAVD